MASKRTRQRGVSLIEVLVSIVILTLGLLGLAGLQVAGIKVTQSSQFRAQAAQFANDMADRMRGNLVAARAGSYDRVFQAVEPGTGTAPAAEVTEWMRRLGNLPRGDGSIAVDTVNNRVTISVRWDDRRALDRTAAEQTATTAAGQMSMFTLVTSLWNN